MLDYKKIVFLPLDLPKLDIPYERIYAKLPNSIEDRYRNCNHIPIIVDTPGSRNKQEFLKYTEESNDFPEIIEYLETYIKPFMVNLPRAMIISTPPGGKNKIHIDCSRKKFDTLQLKFRIVLHGSTDTLYFLDKNKKQFAPSIGNQPFLMAGEWPHGMDNTSDYYKFTLGLGAPWDCELNKPFTNLVERSIKKYDCVWNDFELPNNYERYFME